MPSLPFSEWGNLVEHECYVNVFLSTSSRQGEVCHRALTKMYRYLYRRVSKFTPTHAEEVAVLKILLINKGKKVPLKKLSVACQWAHGTVDTFQQPNPVSIIWMLALKHSLQTLLCVNPIKTLNCVLQKALPHYWVIAAVLCLNPSIPCTQDSTFSVPLHWKNWTVDFN